MNSLSALSLRMQGSLMVFSLLIGTFLAWYALGAIRWDIFMRDPQSRAGRLLRLLLAVLIGTGIAGFVLQYSQGAALMHS